MSEALATQTVTAAPLARTGHQSLEFRDLKQGLDMAAVLQRAGMYKEFKTPEQIVAAVTRGYELGMTPHQALSSIIQIEGRYSLSAESMRALVMANIKPGDGEFFIVNSSDTEATATAFRKGWPEPQTKRLTHAQLAKTNTGKNVNFQSRPRVMLSARVTSEACREWFPDITGGFYTPDEVREIAESAKASAPAQSNLDAVKARFKAKTPEPTQDTAQDADFTVESGYWTDDVCNQWQSAFETADSPDALKEFGKQLADAKKNHPGIPDDINEFLGNTYKSAQARLKDQSTKATKATEPRNPHPSDLEQEPAQAVSHDDDTGTGHLFEGGE